MTDKVPSEWAMKQAVDLGAYFECGAKSEQVREIALALDAARASALEEAMRLCSAYATEAEANGQYEKMYAANGLWSAVRSLIGGAK